MSLTQLIANGLRIAHRRARRKPHLHILQHFKQTEDSKLPDTRWGPEYTASCRYCGAYMTVYFDDADSLEQQGMKPEDHTKLESDAGDWHVERYMVISGNWERFPCGQLKRR